jgi:hypothetical protein
MGLAGTPTTVVSLGTSWLTTGSFLLFDQPAVAPHPFSSMIHRHGCIVSRQRTSYGLGRLFPGQVNETSGAYHWESDLPIGSNDMSLGEFRAIPHLDHHDIPLPKA